MDRPLRVLTTASREWPSSLNGVIEEALLGAYRTAQGLSRRLMVVVGDARGGDRVIYMWAYQTSLRRGGLHMPERHPAHWRDDCVPGRCPVRGHRRMGKNGVTICPAQGMYRNERMVASGADLCLAFIHNRSAGASHTAGLAEGAGIEVVRFTS